MIRSFLKKPACLALTLWFRTIKLQWQPGVTTGGEGIIQRPGVLVLWHEDILPCLWAFRNKGVHVLFSKSKDGDWGAALASHWGYRVIRGSSSRSFTNVKTLARLLRRGWKGTARNRMDPDSVGTALVGMALDGPRGPARQPKEGVLWLHRQAHCPVYTLKAFCSREKRLNSWDRLRIPLPFSKIRLCVTSLESPKTSGEIATALSGADTGVSNDASSRMDVEPDNEADVYQVVTPTGTTVSGPYDEV